MPFSASRFSPAGVSVPSATIQGGTAAKVLVALLISLTVQVAPQMAPAAETKTKPNIVVILADDLGYGDLECYGHPKFRTPHLNRMAAEGARLTHFNTPMPFCAPTRAALLTGRYPFRCGMTSNPAPDGPGDSDSRALPASEILLGQHLKKGGYATGMVGKWHLGHKHAEFLPTHRGFDEYIGIPYSNDMRPVKLVDGDQTAEYPVVQATLTRRYTERAMRFIERNRERPFFLYFAHAMPHKPLATTEEYYKKSNSGLYGDVMAELDASVGMVLDKLKELKLDERTLVIFTSDNGPFFGGSSGGLRGMKGTTWEGGTRVPFLARWPGKIPVGQVISAPAMTMDIFATVLAVTGISVPGDLVIDGRDLTQLLTGKGPGPHEFCFVQQGARLATIRDARWKLHMLAATDRWDPKATERWIDPRGPDGVTILAPYEQYQPADRPGVTTGDATPVGALFDLENDPSEQHDISAKHADVVARLRTAFQALNRQVPPAP